MKHDIEKRLHLATETLLNTADDLLHLVPGCEINGLHDTARKLRVYAAYMRSQAKVNAKLLTGRAIAPDGHDANA